MRRLVFHRRSYVWKYFKYFTQRILIGSQRFVLFTSVHLFGPGLQQVIRWLNKKTIFPPFFYRAVCDLVTVTKHGNGGKCWFRFARIAHYRSLSHKFGNRLASNLSGLSERVADYVSTSQKQLLAESYITSCLVLKLVRVHTSLKCLIVR